MPKSKNLICIEFLREKSVPWFVNLNDVQAHKCSTMCTIFNSTNSCRIVGFRLSLREVAK